MNGYLSLRLLVDRHQERFYGGRLSVEDKTGVLLDPAYREFYVFVRELKRFWSDFIGRNVELGMAMTWSSKSNVGQVPIIQTADSINVADRQILVHLANRESKTLTAENSENCVVLLGTPTMGWDDDYGDSVIREVAARYLSVEAPTKTSRRYKPDRGILDDPTLLDKLRFSTISVAI